jgi:glutamate-1-semialdehyde 2,1-aminomutase
MEPIGKNTVKHGGTYNGNPLCAAAALATLRELDKPGTIDRIARAGEMIMHAIRRTARDRGVPCIVQGVGGMFQVIFTADAASPHHYRDLHRADMKCFAAFGAALLDEGIHINNSGLACWFTSSAHTDDDVARTVDAVAAAMRALA